MFTKNSAKQLNAIRLYCIKTDCSNCQIRETINDLIIPERIVKCKWVELMQTIESIYMRTLKDEMNSMYGKLSQH